MITINKTDKERIKLSKSYLKHLGVLANIILQNRMSTVDGQNEFSNAMNGLNKIKELDPVFYDCSAFQDGAQDFLSSIDRAITTIYANLQNDSTIYDGMDWTLIEYNSKDKEADFINKSTTSDGFYLFLDELSNEDLLVFYTLHFKELFRKVNSKYKKNMFQ